MRRARPSPYYKNCFHIPVLVTVRTAAGATLRCASAERVFRSVASRVPELEHAPGDFVGHVRRHEPRDRARCLRARAHFDPRPAARHERPQTEHLLGRDEAVFAPGAPSGADRPDQFEGVSARPWPGEPPGISLLVSDEPLEHGLGAAAPSSSRAELCSGAQEKTMHDFREMSRQSSPSFGLFSMLWPGACRDCPQSRNNQGSPSAILRGV